MVSNAKRAGLFALVTLALSGCIIVKIPPPARNDPYQPPSTAPVAMKKGDVHKMRFDCGTQVTFRSTMTSVDNLVVSYTGENLSPVDQKTSVALRLTWKGTGASMDIPFNVGSQNTRKAMGEFTMNAPPGNHDLVVAMPNGPDCGPSKITVALK